MASNDGARLTVFGLGFREHDNRKMQQILRHYSKLPSNPGDRGSLFVGLIELGKSLKDEGAHDDVQKLTNWLKNGGEFPFVLAPAPVNGAELPTGSGYSGYITNHPQPAPFFPRGRGGLQGRYRGHRHPNNDQPAPFYTNEIFDNDVDDDDDYDGDDSDDDEREGDIGNGPHDGEQIEYPGDFGDHFNEAPHTSGMQFEEARLAHGQIGNGRQENGIIGGFAMHTRPPGSHKQDSLENDTSVMSADALSKEIECPVCLESYPSSNFPQTRTITEFCEHSDKACLPCLSYSIDVTVQRGALHALACPLCPEKLSFEDVKAYATTEVFERYDYLKMRASMPETFIMCLGPNCGGGQEHAGGEGEPLMVCHSCKFKTCVKHKLPWHEGQTCHEFDLNDSQIERLEQEEATAKILAGRTRICPKCSQGVIKEEGCDHLRCRCGEEWCFVCMCNWENIIRIGPTAHAPTCTYHPNKVRVRRDQQEAGQRRMMELVHGGEVSEELAQAREELRRKRREIMRPLAAAAAEERMKKAQEQKKYASSPPELPKKRKVKLKAAWEEGGHAKKPF